MRRLKLLLIGLLVAGCAVHPPILEDVDYLNQGRESLEQKNYRESREAFQKIPEQFPESKYMAEARLGIADSYFLNEEYIEAAVKYEDFLKYHPRNPLAEQAQFRLATSHYQQRLSLDRDQSETEKTIAEYEKFLKNFPSGTMAEEAGKRLEECRLRLAERELYIGRFYQKKQDYYSAIRRFKYTLTHYQQAPVLEQALFGLAESYWELGKHKEGYLFYEQLLAQYPQSHYTDTARSRMAWYRQAD